MTTVGTGSGFNTNSRSRKDRSKKHKQQLVRKSLLETLEARQLLAVGPQLIGVQPNEGELIAITGANAGTTVLSTSPREIVLRFDDSAGIDPSTFSGIQVKRAGADGLLSSAYLSTDLGTNGRVVLDFSASLPGQQGNGLELAFTQVPRTTGVNGKPASWPVLSVSGNRINIQVNTHPSHLTTASDLIRAMTEDGTVASHVLVKRLRGAESEAIATTVPVGQVLRLDGADAARVSSNLNSGTNTLQVEFLSVRPNQAGQDVRIEVVSRDFGGIGRPNVSVVGSVVRVEVNSNSRYSTTVTEFIEAINLSEDASKLVRARLVSGSANTRIGANPTTYSPLTLVAGDDVSITPSYIGFGDTDREVVIRFAETLPDDMYLIDILGSGPFALRNVAGLPFNGGVSSSVRFDLDLGPTIQSVVPQPVVRNTNGTLEQKRNAIHVYFNDDDLDVTSAQTPGFYQLIYTNNTVSTSDDFVFTPTRVVYDSILNRAELTFDRNLDALVDPNNTSVILPAAALRLRIGSIEEIDPAHPNGHIEHVVPGTEPGTRFETAYNLGGGWAAGQGAKAVIVDSEIKNANPFPLDFPGANNSSGNRDNRYQRHIRTVDQSGIGVIEYNFNSELGRANNSLQLNAITEPQKELVREIFSLYEKYLGVRFVESNSLGLTIAVGDMTAIDVNLAFTAVQRNFQGGLTYAAGPLASNTSIDALILDIQDYNSSDQNVFGSELFRSFMRGIGVLLGLGSADELPQSTVQNNSPLDTANAEPVFPGNNDILHGQFIYRPEGKDIDLYRFTLPSQGGQINIEVSAERLANSSLLDASLRLYRNEGTTAAPRWVEVASNEDYFSKDPRILLDLAQGGEYIVGVSAKGNTTYDPNIEDSGLGGKSEGLYQLRIDYRPPAAQSMVDIDGTPTALDGDGDGRPGGVYNYWFVPTNDNHTTVTATPGASTAHTLWVDKTAAAGGNGTLARPYTTIAAALTQAQNIARTSDLNVVVRILGNTQERAYEIGYNRLGSPLADGATFDVPKDVTVMIDAGAIIKVGRARISAGSSTVSVDRSGSALQILGTPESKVIVTSIHDDLGIGLNPDRSPPDAVAGDWGGIDFRNRIDGGDETRTDRERDGLFMNTIVHADIRYGGGQVFVDGVSQVITPIHMVDSRPTIANNVITLSADAAMSATPNSFREDNYLDPRYQGSDPARFFIPDYDRVGPAIHGNRVTDNTINGLFIRTRTGAGEELESITVAARFDDIDITHVIGENLVIEGRPGGAILDSSAPPVSVVTLASAGAGSLATGTYTYRLVYVDAAGNESIASESTAPITTGANSSVRLNNLPPVLQGGDYVARRIYRSDATGTRFFFVAEINAVATTFVDNGSVTGGELADLPVKMRARLDGSLTVDGGTIIKMQGARIEVTKGGNLHAEGTQARPIIITSMNDSRFGIGGVSTTTGSQQGRVPEAGDWGGIFVGHGSSASLDNVRVAYAGGTTRIEGGFASFNPIEVHQADFRLANSRIEFSMDGVESSGGSTRAGRGANGAAAVFVRGAQPILVNNRFSDNGGAAISIDVNSLTSEIIVDRGRMTGPRGEVIDRIDNRGPLVKDNRISRSDINGMEVRGQTLTTQSIWDDTDIVHVVNSTITSDNLHTYGGLMLKSGGNESLVVKFGGNGSVPGLVATGSPSDNPNRIGGAIQIVGQPNFPVVLTALADDSVGAGFGLDGRPAFDTDNNGTAGSISSSITLPTGPEVNRGTLIDNDVAQSTPGFFSFRPGAGGSVQGGSGGGATAQGLNMLFANQDLISDFVNYIDVGSNGSGISLASTTVTMQPTLIGPDLVASEGTFVGNNSVEVRWRVETRFDNGVARLINTLILDSDQPLGEISFINYLNQSVGQANNDFLYVVGTPGEADFRAYTIDNAERVGFAHGGSYQTGAGLQNASYVGWTADSAANLAGAIQGAGAQFSIAGTINNLPQINDPTLGQVNGLGDATTAFAWRVEPSATTARITSYVELVPTAIQRQATPGAWDGIKLETYSNDRNVAIVTEKESSRASAPAANDTPAQAQHLGQLSRQLASGDENARLGFEIHGSINKPSDVDVYSFNANGRTEVWLDIDRTTLGLDTVVELIAADGTILALSDDSYFEETSPATHPIYSTLSGNSANPLRKSALTQVATSTRGEARDDYGTNLKDAGLRVVLPGQEGVVSLYHIRVRSSNQFPGQPANTPALTDPASVGKGLSRGAYQLQVRLNEVQEHPGSVISYADIRYATTGVTLSGVPRHSPLVGETAEVENANVNNNTFQTAQYLGNILETDRRTISVAGSLSSNTDIDWFSFDIEYQQLLTPLAQYLSTVFDIDYADGIGRADMSMYLFNDAGVLVHLGEDSNILDDRNTSLRTADSTDLGRGSTGTLDPYIGSVELPAGRYYLAVTSSIMVPSVIANRNNRDGENDSGTRIQPLNNGRYIVEDRVGDRAGLSALGPITPQFTNQNSSVGFLLGDVPLYLMQQVGNNSRIYIANGFTGELSNLVGMTNLEDIRDIAIRPNGDVQAFRGSVGGVRNDGNAGYVLIDPGTGQTTVNGTLGVTTRRLNAESQLEDANTGLIFDAITFAGVDGYSGEGGFVVGRRVGNANGVTNTQNILYRFNPNTGAGVSAPADPNAFNIVTPGNPNPPDLILGGGTSLNERGFIDTSVAGGAANRVVVTEATNVNLLTTPLVNDGDSITIELGNGEVVIFEFNSGPEMMLRLNPPPPPNPTNPVPTPPFPHPEQGDEFTIDGVIYRITTTTSNPNVPGVRWVYYQDSMTNAQFAESIRQSIAPGIVVGYDGGRINFMGATTGDFSQLVARNVAFAGTSNGNVTPGTIAIPFVAEDTAATLATRVAAAANGAARPGLSAAANGGAIDFTGATVTATTGSSRIEGVAPGGLVTGIAQVGNALYAVSNAGGLYRIPNGALDNVSSGNIATYVSTANELWGLNFTSLTAGPANAGGGQYANILFATTSDGSIYAFDTAGRFAKVFANGQHRVQTGVSGLEGLAFSNLDYNLWHVTNRRAGDAGHGIIAPNDRTDVNVNGGSSWYFGFENRDANSGSNVSFNDFSNPLGQPRSGGTPLQNTYNFPGGAAGVLESQPFSLAGMTTADKPTLYFNYFLSTEDDQFSTALNDPMLDSFRVYGQGDDGTWVLMATNNDYNTEALRETTRDRWLQDNDPNATTAPATAWRQARVDLGPLAGSKEVRLRFEFSTAGGMGYEYSGGRGLEIRTVSGTEVSDGQSFTVNGQTFEIEMGTQLVVPSGVGIRNLETLQILGTTFTFWNGTGTRPAGEVIEYEVSDTPAILAQKVYDIISDDVYTPVERAVNFTDPSGGSDTIDRALQVGINGSFERYVGRGAIGDNTALAPNFDRDVDLVRMELQAGARIEINVDVMSIGSPLNPMLRLFDSNGNELARNDDFGGTRNSRIEYVIPSNGVYYFGVSASSNANYIPNTPDSGAAGGSQGQYELSVEVTPRRNFVLDGNRIQLDGVEQTVIPADSALRLVGAHGLAQAGSVPVYIQRDMTAEQVASQVKEAMEGFFNPGSRFDTFAQRGSYLDMTGASIDVAGPFTVSGARDEDWFSEWRISNGNPAQRPALRAQNNAFEGVYLDDFIIGLAERGEQVTGARSDTTFVQIDDFIGPVGGTYQLEIRGGSDYGRPLFVDDRPNRIEMELVDALEPNAPQSASQSIVFNDSSSITDGQTIRISDGINSMVFEFDDVALPIGSAGYGVTPGNIRVEFNSADGESAQVIASRFRDIINSQTVQSVLRIGAISSDGSTSTVNSNIVYFVGTVSVEVPTNIGTYRATSGTGDRNTPREQGQVVIENTRVSSSSGYGIVLNSGERDAETNAPHPGSVRNTVTLNQERLAPGAVIVNNELVGNQSGGIQIVGDSADPNLPAAVVPFARIVNNTILGGTVTPVPTPAPATIANDFYSIGSVAFADRVVSYTPGAGGGPVPEAGLQDPSAALGIPDYRGVGEPSPGEGAVSLGRGGSIVLQFTDNILTGSDDARPDLAIYEVGLSENVRVEVSPDGVNYRSVGVASFNNRYIDLDAFGFNSLSQLRYVRLTDEANQGELSGPSVGADIDAVGALSSRPALVYTAGGTGISVGQNASPTLLNNVIVNHTVGIQVDATSNTTVVGGTLYQHNGQNVTGLPTAGQFPIIADPSLPLFVDPANGNLYPVAGSLAIDASIDSLPDRVALLAVKNSLGLLPSPIVTPATDISGQLRVDDPAVATPPGMGESVFKDRGASDRSDSSGPIAVPLNPLDNDALGLDKNPAVGIVELTGVTLPYFDIQLVDTGALSNNSQGSGVDPSTVSPNAILLYKNGQILVEGMDYRFAYDTMSNIIRLTPLAGLWESEAVYEIRYVNTNESAIELSEPSSTIDGTTYTIIDANGVSRYFELDTGIRLTIPQTANGISHTLQDGATFQIDDGTRQVTFEFDSNGEVTSTDNVVIQVGPQDRPSDVAQKIIAAVRSSGLNLQIETYAAGELQILSDRPVRFTPGASNISVSGNTAGTPAYGFQINSVNGEPTGFTDGQMFAIQHGDRFVTFEFDANGALSDPANVRVPMAQTTDALGAAIVAAINGSTLGLTATYTAGGRIAVGSQPGVRLLASDGLGVVGFPGRGANNLVTIDLTEVRSSGQIAELLRSAIVSQNLSGVSLTVLNNRIFVRGAHGVAGLNVASVSGIRDFAGNPMRATELNGSSVTTIFLGEGLDYGDAPDPIYPTRKSSDGPRHVVVDGFSIGPTVTADADARLDDLDQDDGVTINPLVASYESSIVVNVRGVSAAREGYINAWIDFNGNGIFEASEKLNVRGRVVEGDNTLTFMVPVSAVTDRDVAVRVRLSTVSNLGPTGWAPDGEVEDYMVRIAPTYYQNPTNRLDVNGDGHVSPIDVLTVINYINRNGSGRLPPGMSTPPYLDVNGDGYATPLDVLEIVNFINSRPITGNQGGEGELAAEGESSIVVLSNTETVAPASGSWVAANAVDSNSSNTGASTYTSLQAPLPGTATASHSAVSDQPVRRDSNRIDGFYATSDLDDLDGLSFVSIGAKSESDVPWHLVAPLSEKQAEEGDDLGSILNSVVDELN